MTDFLTTAAAYLAAMICGCVALSRLLAWITSPAAVEMIEEIAHAIR